MRKEKKEKQEQASQGKNLRKPKNVKKTIKYLWKYISRNKIALILAFTMVLINIVTSLASLSYLQPIIDNFLQPVGGNLSISARFAGLLHGVIVLGSIFLIGILAAYLQSRLMVIVAQHTITDIRNDLFSHLQKLSVRYFDSNTHGELMSRFTNDVDTLYDATQNGIVTLFSSAITLTGIFSLMIYRNWLLTLVVVVIAPLIAISASKLMKVSSKYFVAQQKNLGAVNGYVEEIMTGQKVVKVFCYEENAEKEFDKLNNALCEAATTAQGYAGMMMPLSKNINYLTYALVAAIGGVLSVFGHISVGGLVVFLQLTQQIGRPINEASNQYNSLVSAIAGAERIFEVMEEKVEEKDPEDAWELIKNNNGEFLWKQPSKDGNAEKLIPVKGDVRFNNVTFGYNENKTILKDISLYAKPGQKIAFVGSTGAGKTTVINLLTRFYEINEGSITVDGIDLKYIKKDSLRNAISIVLQDTHLFTGTVRENIRYGRINATDEEIEEAAKLASAHSFIKRLPHGYDTIIEGDGANLSQGQRQLLNIARAAVADAPILILDEATSSVDTRTELHIEHGLDRLMKDRTTFVIAHRLSTVRNSNAILVMDQGEIIERGTHDELLGLKGRYYQLYTGAIELD